MTEECVMPAERPDFDSLSLSLFACVLFGRTVATIARARHVFLWSLSRHHVFGLHSRLPVKDRSRLTSATTAVAVCGHRASGTLAFFSLVWSPGKAFQFF